MGTNGFPGIHIAKRKRVIQFVTFLSFDRWVGHLSNLWSSGSRELSIPFKGHYLQKSPGISYVFQGEWHIFQGVFHYFHFGSRTLTAKRPWKSDLPIRKGSSSNFQAPFFSSTPGGCISPIRWRSAGGPYGWSPCLRGGGWHLCGQGGLRRTASGAAERLEEACD